MFRDRACRSNKMCSTTSSVFVFTRPPPAGLSMISFFLAPNNRDHSSAVGSDIVSQLKIPLVLWNVSLPDFSFNEEKLKNSAIFDVGELYGYTSIPAKRSNETFHEL